MPARQLLLECCCRKLWDCSFLRKVYSMHGLLQHQGILVLLACAKLLVTARRLWDGTAGQGIPCCWLYIEHYAMVDLPPPGEPLCD